MTTEANTETAASQSEIPGVIAYLALEDATAALEFYQQAFDAKLISKLMAEDGKRIMHCQVEIHGGTLMFADCFPEWGMGYKPLQGVVLHIASDESQYWWDKAVAAGMEVTMPLQIAFWGDLYGQAKDRFGVTWGFVGPAPAGAAAAKTAA